MGRNWATLTGTMGNNGEANKQFERAAKEAGLTEEEKRKFSKLVHEEKEFEAGDRLYQELLTLAKMCKK